MLEELEIHNLGPIRSALIAPAGGMTAITGETGAGKSMLLSAIRLISGGPSDGGRVSVGAQEAWAQGVFEVASSPAAVAAAREAGFEPEDGELFLSRKVPASGRSRSMLSGRSVPRSVLASVAAELVTIHGQADQLRIATVSRQREFLDRYAGDEVALAAYGKTWNALRAMDERLERLNSQESSMRQQADYLRESIERINRVDPQPGEMDELRARRDRIENAAEIAEGVTRALGALDASQVADDVESASAADLIDRASQALRAIHVEGVFSELADRLDSISTDLSDVVFSLSGEVDNEASVEDLDAINGRIHELDELTRRWGPELSDVITWRDKAVYDLEDLDASPEKVEQLEAERATANAAAMPAAPAPSKDATGVAVPAPPPPAPVLIIGFGRFGQVIGRLLMANKLRITVLERDISAVNLMRKYGYKVYYGDATQVDLLRSAGAEAAESIVITCNEPEDTMKLVEICQQHFPHLHILARARGRVEAHELLQAGVTQFSRETFSSALELGRKTLVTLGMHPHQAQRAQLHFRRLDMRMLRELIPMHADTVQISRAREARRELEEIFQREMQQERRQLDGWDEFE